ncbi:hypothetical protein ACJX0J_018988, partial [Zea mays]
NEGIMPTAGNLKEALLLLGDLEEARILKEEMGEQGCLPNIALLIIQGFAYLLIQAADEDGQKGIGGKQIHIYFVDRWELFAHVSNNISVIDGLGAS